MDPSQYLSNLYAPIDAAIKAYQESEFSQPLNQFFQDLQIEMPVQITSEPPLIKSGVGATEISFYIAEAVDDATLFSNECSKYPGFKFENETDHYPFYFNALTTALNFNKLNIAHYIAENCPAEMLNTNDARRFPPLSMITKHDELKGTALARLMIERGVDVNAIFIANKYPDKSNLSLVADIGNRSFTELLIKNGAKVFRPLSIEGKRTIASIMNEKFNKPHFYEKFKYLSVINSSNLCIKELDQLMKNLFVTVVLQKSTSEEGQVYTSKGSPCIIS